MHLNQNEIAAIGPALRVWAITCVTTGLSLLQPMSAQAAIGETSVNLALVATPSSSYCSGDTSVGALNDGNEPRNSRQRGPGSYGNWPRTGTQWVQYEWSQPISTDRTEVYWWDDRQGVRLPASCRLKYWNGEGFVEVANASGRGVEGNQFNTTTFDKITTSKLRLEMEGSESYSTGLLEWRVFDSGESPKFPPSVVAGVDRVVMLVGKTYLSGEVRSLQTDDPLQVTWSKLSGPGDVRFEDVHSTETTASFARTGDYVLQLAATQNGLTSRSTLAVVVENPPKEQRLDVVYTTPYKIDSPLWNSRARALMVNWIPHCIRQINSTNLSTGQGGIDNFVESAKALRGEPHGPHKGYVFANAWVHQTIESMCIALMVDPRGDPDIQEAQGLMKATLEDWIPKILAAQEPDGYLQTAYTLADRNRWPERWNASQRRNHEGYVAGYFIESAINHYTLTRGTDTRLYDAAKKLGDCWVANIGPGKKKWYDEHQEMEQALVRFGRFVNDMEGGGRGDAYIALARFLLDNRGNGDEYDQSHVPVQQQYEAVGHAVRAAYSYSGMADIAAETADTDYQSAVMSLWDNMINRKYYVTGGIGSGETSEGFGPDYSLRQNAYCEACSSCGLIFFQYKLNLAYHDARYADLYEETMYNALLGSLDIEGEHFFYQNPLDTRGGRSAWHACPCCVGNIPRTLLMIPTWTYVKSPDAVYVNLFIGSTVQVGEIAGTEVTMVQKTDYPWRGDVAITVNPEQSREFSVRIRVPRRDVSELYSATPSADGILSMSLNGDPIQPAIERGYAILTRTWARGDTIQFELPMKVQRVKGSELIEAVQGKMALRYGPLVYNVERVDQDISRAMDPDAPLSVEWKPDLLEGVMVIKGRWADGEPLVAIPNFARCNRDSDAAGGRGDFGGPGAVGGGDGGQRARRGPSSVVWIKEQP